MRALSRTLLLLIAIPGTGLLPLRAAIPPVTRPPGASAATPATAAGVRVAGFAFDDANRNGRRDTGEAGVTGVPVSDLHDVTVTGADGSYALVAAPDAAIVAMSLPDGWSAAGRWWRLLDRGAARKSPVSIDFALARRPASGSFTFLHASDTHLTEASLSRTRMLRAMVEERQPDFVLITGDLIRDALRVGEKEARGQYELLEKELAAFPVPVFAVPGNHDLFGIERASSLVGRDHPMYGRALCRFYVGPEYFSFTWGGVHFVGLHSVDFEDTAYYGHIDATQLEWLRRDLARVPSDVPVVSFNHIPFVSAVERLSGYTDAPPVPTLVRIDGSLQYRHVVSNTAEVLEALGGHRLEIALGGHLHTSERLVLDTDAGRVRFHQTGAVVGPSDAPGFRFVSGVTLYHVENGRIDDGTFLPLDAPAAPARR